MISPNYCQARCPFSNKTFDRAGEVGGVTTYNVYSDGLPTNAQVEVQVANDAEFVGSFRACSQPTVQGRGRVACTALISMGST